MKFFEAIKTSQLINDDVKKQELSFAILENECLMFQCWKWFDLTLMLVWYNIDLMLNWI